MLCYGNENYLKLSKVNLEWSVLYDIFLYIISVL